MDRIKTITARQYLTERSIPFTDRGGELITKCVFNSCDKDSREGEGHLSFKASTGQYYCFKCGATGNLITLARRLGDDVKRVIIPDNEVRRNRKKIDDKLVDACHKAITPRIREYLTRERGLSEEVIELYKIGCGKFYDKAWITIPIRDMDRNYAFFKLRQDPVEGDEKMTYPGGEAQLYGWDMAQNTTDRIIVCEGELDRLILLSKNVSAVTSTAGAGTFKKQWASYFNKECNIYLCYDNDDAGRDGAENTARILKDAGLTNLHIITLPEEVGDKGDITDYFMKLNGSVDDLFGKYAKPYPEKIDASKFQPLSPKDTIKILGLTIKHDEANKHVTFLCELSSQTEDSQFNTSFNGPSSTGKSYIPIETAGLFPPAAVIEIGYCSPTAFFHDHGAFDKELGCYIMDLSRKILIFLDQPHMILLQHLRPLLSHDKKVIEIKITDKTQKFGLKTKTVKIIGYPAVIFCSAGLRIDEQESTRFLLLSPEDSQEKIREAICQTITKESDGTRYNAWLDANPERKLLKQRIEAIRRENIQDIKIESPDKIKDLFLSEYKVLKPRHQRDIKRVISLVKALALLNLWWRKREGQVITANDEDINNAFDLWKQISESQEYNLPPYIYNIYKDVIIPACKDKNPDLKPGMEPRGLTRQEVLKKHYSLRGRMLDSCKLRQEILPMLEMAGLIYQEIDPNDKRQKLVYPVLVSSEPGQEI